MTQENNNMTIPSIFLLWRCYSDHPERERLVGAFVTRVHAIAISTMPPLSVSRTRIQEIPLYGVQESGRCRYCGCTDGRACPDGCSWVDIWHTVCSNPICVDMRRAANTDLSKTGFEQDLMDFAKVVGRDFGAEIYGIERKPGEDDDSLLKRISQVQRGHVGEAPIKPHPAAVAQKMERCGCPEWPWCVHESTEVAE